ncbi:MAG: type III pantothenate kinase, partial [Sphingobacteriales bacterium]
MSRILCVDWGNSLVKAAIFNEDNSIVIVHQCPDVEAMDCISRLIKDHQPTQGIFCSVTNHSKDAEQMVRAQLPTLIRLNSDTRLPIMNAYSSPETLGADRLAMAVAAQSLYPDANVLAISLGTCITYNFVQKNKAFRGGAISPGLKMRMKSMHQFTDKLPEVHLDGDLLLLGYDTATCMRSGAVFGMAAEIDGMIEAFSAKYPDFNAVLTGGDAGFFGNKLKSKIFADPDL